MEATVKCDRRKFLKASGAAIAGTCLGSLCSHSCSPFSSVSGTAQVPMGSYRIVAGRVVLDLKKTSDLTAIGGSVKLEFNHPENGMPIKIVLIHPESVSYLAFANECTHKRKELEYDHATRKMQCVSGHSEFDLNGRVLEGNAEAPLKSYPIEQEGNTLIVRIDASAFKS